MLGVLLSVSTDHHVRIRKRYDTLRDRLLAKSVASYMFQADALTPHELENIQSCPTEGGSAELLLNILLKAPFQVYACFLEATRKAEQDDLYRDLICGVCVFSHFLDTSVFHSANVK